MITTTDSVNLAVLAQNIRDIVLPDMVSAEGKHAVAHAAGVLADLAQTLADESENL